MVKSSRFFSLFEGFALPFIFLCIIAAYFRDQHVSHFLLVLHTQTRLLIGKGLVACFQSPFPPFTKLTSCRLHVVVLLMEPINLKPIRIISVLAPSFMLTLNEEKQLLQCEEFPLPLNLSLLGSMQPYIHNYTLSIFVSSRSILCSRAQETFAVGSQMSLLLFNLVFIEDSTALAFPLSNSRKRGFMYCCAAALNPVRHFPSRRPLREAAE